MINKKLKIRKGATVEVITGTDKGKKGKVMAIKTNPLSLKVAGVRVQTKADRQDGLKKVEGFIDYSNVKLVSNPTTTSKKKPTKSAKA